MMQGLGSQGPRQDIICKGISFMENLTPKDFRLGFIERRGGIILSHSDRFYRVKGFYRGKFINNSFRTLTEARKNFRKFPCKEPASSKYPLSLHSSSVLQNAPKWYPIPSGVQSSTGTELTTADLNEIILNF